ncbi:hypothetical protein Poli38472_004799 [Pythium oligandrum]|uniref:NEDD8-activating enzyme E1 regulatory subunit n=1 Tax=Pythium oligandrum TaxID=41045 RepID=A0A8K1FDS6_PYTOL|nr:hypothetical protein Poli38472_004799 [Pythium oligandrum]|eukprot:TMW59730.1 hypothetical protein Poli38472_004799 [Pythium oligandrum]
MATSDKYDRQLRLWGADGQRRLGSTHILLIHASATGAETLKNLVLPGVKQFTILDDHQVTQADTTNNFFVSSAALGKSRAVTVTELLLEMNSDVSGSYRHANPQHVLENEPEYLDQFQLVIATQVEERVTKRLGELCASKKIPLILVNSYGLLGYFRLQVAQHTILDAKHDPPLHELRLSQPFPALQAYAAQFDLPTLETIDHAHVPFVVILLKAVESWRASHDGVLPKTFPEKNEFKQLIQSMAWGPTGHEVNFIEAVENAYKAYSPPIVPGEVSEVLDAAKEIALTAETPEFWFLARSLADFVAQNDGMLPITGVVPDMTASTETYVVLQQLYVTKAKEDAVGVRTILQQHLASVGLAADSISEEQVEAFCKNSYNLAMLDTRTITEEFKAADLDAIDFEEENQQQSPLIWYFLLRAVSAFVPVFGRYPGSQEAKTGSDTEWLVARAKILASGSPVAEWISHDHALEMVRSCEVELHNIAALMGGVASQEAVKLITHQFLPLNHTYIFNGISGLAATYNV